MKHRIELNIDELVLYGFSVHDKFEIAEAVQQELTRLFNEGGVPSSFTHHVDVNALRAGSFQHNQNASDTTLGNNIATSVYKGFTNGK